MKNNGKAEIGSACFITAPSELSAPKTPKGQNLKFRRSVFSLRI